jgi:hypothetical protein
MTRCLPDATLVWLRAGDGGADERAHVTACGVCGDRYRRLGRELTTVRYVLLHTDEPGTRMVARTRSWMPVAAAAAALVVTLAVWGHVALRRLDAPGSGPRQLSGLEASVFLTEISLEMFSIDPRPAAAVSDVRVARLPADAPDRGVDCGWPDWAAVAGCDETAHVDRLRDLFEPSDNEL